MRGLPVSSKSGPRCSSKMISPHAACASVENRVPPGYDLGEDLRFVLLSTTEGEDKSLK
jgi:hypothetical protein